MVINMTTKELIDRNEIIGEWEKILYRLIPDKDGKHSVSLEVVIELLKNAPTVDAEPIVYCEYCKYRTWFAPYYGCGNFESPFYAAAQEDVPIMTKPNDFCSYGKHRDGDE